MRKGRKSRNCAGIGIGIGMGGAREREREKWLKILAQALQYFAVLETDFFQ